MIYNHYIPFTYSTIFLAHHLFLAPTRLKKCKIPSVRSSEVIVRFMDYKGFKVCCKGQEQSRRVKKGQEVSRRVKKCQEGSRRFKNVQEGS